MDKFLKISSGIIGKTYLTYPDLWKIQLINVGEEDAKVLVLITNEYETIPLDYQVLDPNSEQDCLDQFSKLNTQDESADSFVSRLNEKLEVLDSHITEPEQKPTERTEDMTSERKGSKIAFVLDFLKSHEVASAQEIAEAVMAHFPDESNTVKKEKNYIAVILYNLKKKYPIEVVSRGKYRLPA